MFSRWATETVLFTVRQNKNPNHNRFYSLYPLESMQGKGCPISPCFNWQLRALVWSNLQCALRKINNSVPWKSKYKKPHAEQLIDSKILWRHLKSPYFVHACAVIISKIPSKKHHAAAQGALTEVVHLTADVELKCVEGTCDSGLLEGYEQDICSLEEGSEVEA